MCSAQVPASFRLFGGEAAEERAALEDMGRTWEPAYDGRQQKKGLQWMTWGGSRGKGLQWRTWGDRI